MILSDKLGIHGEETRSAINRSSLRREERDSCLVGTFRTVNDYFNPLFRSGCLRIRDSGQPLIFCLLAGFTSFWRILQSLVMEKESLASGPDKFLSAINAGQVKVFKFDRLGG